MPGPHPGQLRHMVAIGQTVNDINANGYPVKAGVKQTGTYDADTHAALMAAIDPKAAVDPVSENPGKQVEVTGLNVNIRKGNGTQYDRVVILPYGTRLPYVATAENGWNAVVVNDQVGWISGNFSKLL